MPRQRPSVQIKSIILLVIGLMVAPLHAQEPATEASPAPATSQAAPPAAPDTPLPAADPCADLREQLQTLQAAHKKEPVKHLRKKTFLKKKSKKAGKSPTAGKRPSTRTTKKSGRAKTIRNTTSCAGAMPMKEVRDILGTTRNLSGRNLNCLDFTGYDLKGVNFSGATMIKTLCVRANMEDTNLERTNLTDADLTGSTLHLARLAATIFTRTKLDGALWTDRRPCAPGSIGACRDTFQK